ncbi:MAG: preprotein translocase subunit SecG [Candidatus Omnitrophota bacterium]|nr:preprotein translocase subunit SecG [Candidatus Omnitrophota bacterium]MDZ4242137.1 preprotein translocase subunit SecG [Candidatus Omnitrophota bacterium]
MTGLVIFVHTVVCIFLVAAILMQKGKGGGLAESFASAETMLGARTNAFMVKTTAILTTLFIVTCLSLAFLSAKKGQSIVPSSVNVNPPAKSALDVMPPLPVNATP